MTAIGVVLQRCRIWRAACPQPAAGLAVHYATEQLTMGQACAAAVLPRLGSIKVVLWGGCCMPVCVTGPWQIFSSRRLAACCLAT